MAGTGRAQPQASTATAHRTPARGQPQTDADRERVVEGLGSSDRADSRELTDTIKRLTNRWFVMRDASSSDGPVLLQPRWSMSYLKGQMTRREIGTALGGERGGGG